MSPQVSQDLMFSMLQQNFHKRLSKMYEVFMQ